MKLFFGILLWSILVTAGPHDMCDLIKAYCHLVRDQDFYKTYQLSDYCALYVKEFGQQVVNYF